MPLYILSTFYSANMYDWFSTDLLREINIIENKILLREHKLHCWEKKKKKLDLYEINQLIYAFAT